MSTLECVESGRSVQREELLEPQVATFFRFFPATGTPLVAHNLAKLAGKLRQLGTGHLKVI